MFEDFIDFLKIKRYSPNTITAYVGLLKSFQDFMGEQIPLKQAESSYIRKKFSEKILSRDLAFNTQKQLASAIKLYLQSMYARSIDLVPVAPRRPQRVLPDILSTLEVKELLDKTKNLKHRTALTVIYGLGLRSGELLSLEINNIDGERNLIKIVAAKGKKDRFLPLTVDLKEILRQYYKQYRPVKFLIEGNKAGENYSAESLRAIFKAATRRAGIRKKVTVHSLRHSYATHLMEAGVSIRVIQELLGHNDIKTTLIYTHVSQPSLSKIPNVLDFLK
jgi:site-specific recombinase XerD